MSVAALETALRAAGSPKSDKTIKRILEHLASGDGGGRVVDLSGGGQSSARKWARKE